MATAGALVGASIAGLAYKLSGQNYTITFALATVPATLALLLTVSVSAQPLQCRNFLQSTQESLPAMVLTAASGIRNLECPLKVWVSPVMPGMSAGSSPEGEHVSYMVCRPSATQQSHRLRLKR